MGLMQRRKGRAFEQRIARILRERWPDATIRRASQADRAHQSDVYITGGPAVLSRLWLECQDARNPTPTQKLIQAEHDACGDPRGDRLPVAVWHKTGARVTNATMPMWVLDELRFAECSYADSEEVTMALDDLLHVIDTSPHWAQTEAA